MFSELLVRDNKGLGGSLLEEDTGGLLSRLNKQRKQQVKCAVYINAYIARFDLLLVNSNNALRLVYYYYYTLPNSLHVLSKGFSSYFYKPNNIVD